MPLPLAALLGFVPDLLKSFLGNKAAREDNISTEQMAVLDQYAAEFQGPERLGGWNSFVDGLNRLVRPLMTFGTIGLFVWCAFDPISFTVAMTALQAVPEMLWYILLSIVAFWFGGRVLENAQIGRMKPSADIAKIVGQMNAVRALDQPPEVVLPAAAKADMDRRAAEAHNIAPISDEDYKAEIANEMKPMSLPAILEWNRRQKVLSEQK